ncbi:MAG: ferredoxin--NADP+ reductase [Saprospiraceae bacterium]|jgi:ferredoxin--NADP+ reductase
MANLITESVTDIHHWNESLFSFKTTRSDSFRFENGEFVMMGIEVEGKPLMRAYSIVSANYEQNLEFFSIKVADGPLTSRLQNLKIGDRVYVSTKPTGTLTKDRLLPGKNLYLLSSGTGIAPFMAIIKDPEVYNAFDKIILTHSVRYKSELAYQDEILNGLPNNEYFGDDVKEKLIYYPTVTREDYTTTARLTTMLASGQLASDNGLPPLSLENDRFMMCGNPSLLMDLCDILEEKGFKETVKNDAGHYAIERAFVEK